MESPPQPLLRAGDDDPEIPKNNPTGTTHNLPARQISSLSVDFTILDDYQRIRYRNPYFPALKSYLSWLLLRQGGSWVLGLLLAIICSWCVTASDGFISVFWLIASLAAWGYFIFSLDKLRRLVNGYNVAKESQINQSLLEQNPAALSAAQITRLQKRLLRDIQAYSQSKNELLTSNAIWNKYIVDNKFQEQLRRLRDQLILTARQQPAELWLMTTQREILPRINKLARQRISRYALEYTVYKHRGQSDYILPNSQSQQATGIDAYIEMLVDLTRLYYPQQTRGNSPWLWGVMLSLWRQPGEEIPLPNYQDLELFNYNFTRFNEIHYPTGDSTSSSTGTTGQYKSLSPHIIRAMELDFCLAWSYAYQAWTILKRW